MKGIVINILRKCGSMIGRIPKPKFLFHKNLELFRFAIIAETFMRWRRGQLTYFQLLPPIIVSISMSKMITYFHNHYLEREWDTAYALLSNKTKEHFRKQCTILNVFIGICYFCGIYPAIYLDKPYVVYGAFAVVGILGSYMAFEDDRILWRITIGNRIDVDRAHEIYRGHWLDSYRFVVDVLDIRYFLCDSLRRRDTKLNTVKALVEMFPGY